MPTPRSEFYEKAKAGEGEIREPKSKIDAENQVDHYAVLAQFINRGVQKYLSNPEYYAPLEQTRSIDHLDANFSADLRQVILTTLEDTGFETHHANLVRSTETRYMMNAAPWETVKEGFKAGSDTFVMTCSKVFDILKGHFGVEAAAHDDNWLIINKLALLNITAFSAYFRTYLVVPENHPGFIEQIKQHSDGRLHFKPGYPSDALVTEASTSRYAAILSTKDLILHESAPLTTVRNVKSKNVKIGCPVTFDSSVVSKLWSVYANQAHRITLTHDTSSDDTEASAR